MMNEEQEEYLLNLIGLLLSKYIHDTGDIHFHRATGTPAKYQTSMLKNKLKELENPSSTKDRFRLTEDNYIFDAENNIGFIGVHSLCKCMNELSKENKELNNLKNLCDDYNIRLEDIYTIVEDAIERGSKE